MDEVEQVVCIAGGSGVSYLMGVAQNALAAFDKGLEQDSRRDAGGEGKRPRLRIVRLVWVLKEYGSSCVTARCSEEEIDRRKTLRRTIFPEACSLDLATDFLLTLLHPTTETFLSLLPFLAPYLSPSMTLSIYVTSFLQPPPQTNPNLATLSTSDPFPHIAVHHLRPTFPTLIRAILEEDDPRSGVEVMACGPQGLVAEVTNAVGAMSVRDRVRRGGVKVRGEGFSL